MLSVCDDTLRNAVIEESAQKAATDKVNFRHAPCFMIKSIKKQPTTDKGNKKLIIISLANQL